MDTVDGECRKSHGVAPEEYFVVDLFGVFGELFARPALPVKEDKSEVGGDRGKDYEERILECRGRGRSDYEVTDYSAAGCRHDGKDIDAEDVHLLFDACEGA